MGDKHPCEKEASDQFPPLCTLRTKPTTQVCAPTGSGTGDPSVYRTTLQLTESHSGQDMGTLNCFLIKVIGSQK